MNLTLKKEIIPIYRDKDGNFVFQDTYLEEENDLQEPSRDEQKDEEIINMCKKLMLRMEKEEKTDLSQVQKLIVSKNFDGKINAIEWMNNFEKECERIKIIKDEDKIQILKLFLNGNAIDWYEATLRKLSIKEQWSEWRDSFEKTYADKDWDSVLYAYNFKYINGSLMDYALKKQRLIMDTERGITEQSIINHIVIGLPKHIRHHLDKEEIQTTEKLMNQLRRYNFESKREEEKLIINKTHNPNNNLKKKKQEEKRPCDICDSLGKPGRFHQKEACWNKNKGSVEVKTSYSTEIENKDEYNPKN